MGEVHDHRVTRTAIIRGAFRGQRRRRIVALAACVMAVVAVMGGLGVASRIGVGTPPTPVTPSTSHHDPLTTAATTRDQPSATATTAQGRPAVIPAGSELIRYTAVEVVSPVAATVDGPKPGDNIDWDNEDGTLAVSWSPSTAGADVSAAAPIRAAQGSSAVPRSPGYLITGTAQLPDLVVVDPSHLEGGPLTGTKAALSNRAMTVNGRPAVLTRVQPGMQALAGRLATASWISWQLTSGKYIHVWDDPTDAATLQRFADGITEQDTKLPRPMTVGVTLPGLTAESDSVVATVRTVADTSIVLCPAIAVPVAPSSPEYHDSCLSVVISTGGSASAHPGGDPVTVDGLAVQTFPASQTAFAQLGGVFDVMIFGWLAHPLSRIDLATVAASIRIAPGVLPGISPYHLSVVDVSAPATSGG